MNDRSRGWTRLTLERVKLLFEMGALIVAGWWAYQQFNIEAPGSPNLLVSVNATPITTGGGQTALLIDVALKNVGKVQIRPGKHSKGEDCELEVIKFTQLNGHVPGAHEPYNVIDWNMGGGIPTKIVERFNLLRYYPQYAINAGVEYHERVVVPVDPGFLYGVKARFFNEAYTVGDFQYVNVSKDERVDSAGSGVRPAR